jgi:hypothetical protein
MQEVEFLFYILLACSIASIVYGAKSKEPGPWRYVAIIFGVLMLLGLIGCLEVGKRVSQAIQ